MYLAATAAALTTIVWGFTSGWIVAWLAHRWEDGTGDDEGIAQWVPATCDACHSPIHLDDVRPDRMLRHRVCPQCGHELDWSWWAPPLLVTIVALTTVLVLGLNWFTVAFLWLPPVIALCSILDLRTMIIPKRVVWVGSAVALVLIVAASLIEGVGAAVEGAVIGGLGYFAVLFALWFVYPRGMGFGDVRFALLLGLYLGWLHFMLPVVALVFASVIGIAVGLAARLSRGGREFPFGPGMALGALCAVWFYEPIISRLNGG